MILAGGSGTRFWPRSRRGRPKQLLPFGSERSLLQETYQRVRAVAEPDRVLVLTNTAYATEVRAQLPELRADQVVAEPASRDTAAALGLGSLLLQHQDPDATVLVLPSDQRIAPLDRFVASVRGAEEMVNRWPDHIVVFGIQPTFPATGYGYIERSEAVGEFAGLTGYRVHRFREKPDREAAAEYLARGGFYWNAGMFCFRADTMRKRIQQHLPALHAELAGLLPSLGRPAFAAELARRYPSFLKQSIDFGVMERCPERLVLATDYDWDDLGSFLALARHLAADPEGNRSLGQCVSLDARDNVVDAGTGLVALLGVEGLVVVHTEDVTLVCRKEDAERIKQLLDRVDDPRFL